MTQPKEKVNYALAVRNFFSEVVEESKKVVWPTTETMVQSTSLVVAVILILSVFMGLADWMLNMGFKLVE